jgi:hypothetical protein
VKFVIFIILSVICFFGSAHAPFSDPDKEYWVYQFPKDKVPRIDGDFTDWDMVPAVYEIGLNQLMDTRKGNMQHPNPLDKNISVKVGWVNGLNRLYFYVELEDDYWDFNDSGLKQDIFELVVDADLSGGPFIKKSNVNKNKYAVEDLHFKGHGAHAQNYHIFTPVIDKDWAMIWGNTPWIKDFPYANVSYNYNFKQGERGKLKMEFWITPFDYAAIEGLQYSKVSRLKENEFIGLSWCILEYDGNQKIESFINLAHNIKMINDASYLNSFKLMPLENKYLKPIEANWSFIEIDRTKRWFQFKDESIGDVHNWYWDFGDGNTSNEKNPSHQYNEPGEWTVILTVENSKGKSTHSKVWDVVTK